MINLRLIENIKETLKDVRRLPGTQEFIDKEYSLFSDLQADLKPLLGVKMKSYFNVSKTEFELACNRDEKPLFLFKISCKDLSFAESNKQGKRKTRGMEDLNTMYFKQGMDPNQNIVDIGSAQISYRPASISKEDRVIHPAGQPIAKKTKYAKNETTIYPYDIIKDKRYTVPNFQISISFTFNPDAPNNVKNHKINVNEFLKNNPDVNIIGLDRGERNLVYLSLIDQKGNIILQESLNIIKNETTGSETDYNALLDSKSKRITENQKNWSSEETIRDARETYVGHAIHHIYKLMIKHNAIIVLEDLNTGFKNNRRGKVKKAVYQLFEINLIKKLNYLVLKNIAQTDEVGGLSKALQLTNNVKDFDKQGKQNGFLFFVNPSYTSSIDPTTGFVNFLDTTLVNLTKSKAFFNGFESIKYNIEKEYFEFKFDYKNFTEYGDGTRTKWTVCTHGDSRCRYNKQTKINEDFKINEILASTLKKHDIEYLSGRNIKNEIISCATTELFKDVLFVLSLVLNMRQRPTNPASDFILSPVLNDEGVFFDSRNADETQPKDGDANGAYNIALKGLMCLEKISAMAPGIEMPPKYLNISNNEWLLFIQQKKYKTNSVQVQLV